MKLFFKAIFLTTLIPSVLCAEADKKTVQKLNAELAAKKEQLTLLGRRVREQIEAINFLNKNIMDSGIDFIKERKKKLESTASAFTWVTYNDVTKEFLAENAKFITAFYDVNNKKEQYIVTNTFLSNEKVSFDATAAIFKFCAINNWKEKCLLQALLVEWENLNDEVFALEIKLNEVIQN
jgi:molybdopterin converting factor small subunit